MKLIYVVRRLGPVGGMERYVFETIQQLLYRGHEVKVLCETCLGEAPQGLSVHELGAAPARPRWLALSIFGKRVSAWLRDHPHPGWLIHSHERLGCHHVTTYHGQPFATIFERHWTRLLSWRVVMQLYLERRELAVAQRVVPVSQYSRQQLARYYPQFAHKLTKPVEPGVGSVIPRTPRLVPRDGGMIGFVGKEWRRKGLPFAVAVAERLRRVRPHLTLRVQGPEAAEIRHLFDHWTGGGYQLSGWTDQPDYANLDVLIHPARAEPFGMVIAEAMAARVPVVVSDVCGAADQVTSDTGAVLGLGESVEAWADAIERQLLRGAPVAAPTRGWAQVAEEYVALYAALQAGAHTCRPPLELSPG